MFLRIGCMLALGAIMLWVNAGDWRAGAARDRVVCAVLLGISVYLGILYATDADWPNLNDFIQLLFKDAAKQIVESVRKPA
ncbi:hypothetical protein [Cohnella sp. GCM10027633]|uniref:hypothetical protein n=1 Tax=unclassified Cohnella TaxID=2636738 RepID=UPI00363DD837